MGSSKETPGAGPFSVSGRVDCSCGRSLVALGSDTAFTCERRDGSPVPPDSGLVLTCECGISWSFVDEQSARPTHATRKLRVFVFDDEELMRDLTRSMLEARGYDVLTFKRPVLCAGCEAPPGTPCADIILSDVRMPGVSGIEFAQNQRSVGCQCTHFALMSGDWSPAHIEEAKAADCKIWQKPFSTKEFGDWLDECETTVDLTVPLHNGYRTQNSPHG